MSWSDFKREANFIGGQWVGADGGGTIDVTNPATGEVIGTVPNAGAAEARRAIEAAESAFQSFSHTTADERARMLRRLHAAIMDNQRALAELLTVEQGKPLAESMGEVGASAAYVLWFSEEARRVYGDVIPSPWGERRILVVKQPVGVVAAITPWNFPSSMLARKIGPALATGCTSVVKPATQTPIPASPGACWPSRRAIRRVSSTSSPARPRPSAASSPRTRPCARSPSPAPRRSARC